MPEFFNSSLLQEYLARWQAGDLAAVNELFRTVIARLEKLARRMLRGFPNVRGHVDTDDVLQSSLVRLLRTLQRLKPATTRDFFNLAAVHVRRELLDIARRTRGKTTVSLEAVWNHQAHSLDEPQAPDPSDIDRWVHFHTAVDLLPVEEREVFGLVYYHGWKQAQIAELFGVDERTIRRRWSSACQRLRKIVGPVFFEK